MSRSLIYSDIRIYRLLMNVLYGGRYERRFEPVVRLIGKQTRSVCELCFGDTRIAEHCRARNIEWTGLDMNPVFCRTARENGFRVVEGDLFAQDLPTADVYVMSGSLYHFHDRLEELVDRIFDRTERWILSEPIRSVSQRGDLLGRIARRSADPGDGIAAFRYDEHTLRSALEALGLRVTEHARNRDIVVEVRRK